MFNLDSPSSFCYYPIALPFFSLSLTTFSASLSPPSISAFMALGDFLSKNAYYIGDILFYYRRAYIEYSCLYLIYLAIS